MYNATDNLEVITRYNSSLEFGRFATVNLPEHFIAMSFFSSKLKNIGKINEPKHHCNSRLTLSHGRHPMKKLLSSLKVSFVNRLASDMAVDIVKNSRSCTQK